MPETFKMKDSATGDLRDVALRSTEEVAVIFHCSTAFVKRQLAAGRWHAYKLANRYWFSPDHIDAIWALEDTGRRPTPPKLGLAVDPTDEEPIR